MSVNKTRRVRELAHSSVETEVLLSLAGWFPADAAAGNVLPSDNFPVIEFQTGSFPPPPPLSRMFVWGLNCPSGVQKPASRESGCKCFIGFYLSVDTMMIENLDLRAAEEPVPQVQNFRFCSDCSFSRRF